MTVIKHQSQIHKAFADELDAHRQQRLEEIKANNPDMADELETKPKTYLDALKDKDDNYQICRYYYLKDEDGQEIEFDNADKRTKTVAQVVRANVRAYDVITAALDGEEENEDYEKIYRKLKGAYDDYFSLAAEDCLVEMYGKRYTDFRAKEQEKWAKIDASRSEKRKQSQEK